MRGYFGIGVEGASKAMNVGSVLRTAHAFGASFVFTIAAVYKREDLERSDTAASEGAVPFYEFAGVSDLELPAGCELVGIELLDEAVDLPSFRHPPRCAYVLGPERGSLSPALLSRCRYTVKIPTRFCINLGLAAAIVLYDRQLQLGRFAPRPTRPGGPREPLPAHRFGPPLLRGTRGGKP